MKGAWQPFATVPRDQRDVLLAMPRGYRRRVVLGYFGKDAAGKEFGVIDGDFLFHRPTPLYWMPMPEPPEEVE